MAVSLVDKIKGFLLAPGETFRKIKDEEPAAVYKYLAAIVVIEAVLVALVSVVFFYNHPIKGIIESSGVADVGGFVAVSGHRLFHPLHRFDRLSPSGPTYGSM